jgi:hypothetical protein
MAFKIFITLLLITSCSIFNLDSKHRYLQIEKIIRMKEKAETTLSKIYKIVGKPTTIRDDENEKGVQYLFRRITTTTDFRYSITLKNNKILSFMIAPSENKINNIKIDEALKIFSHLKLNKTQRWNLDNPHVVLEEFYYRTDDKKFEIQANSKGRVEYITWFK